MSIWVSLLFIFIWWIIVKIYFDRHFKIMEDRYQEIIEILNDSNRYGEIIETLKKNNDPNRYQEIIEILKKDIKANSKYSGEAIEECFKAVPYFEKEEDK